MSSKINDIKTKSTNEIYVKINSIRNNNEKSKAIRSWDKAAKEIENSNNESPTAKHMAGELRDVLSMMGGRKTRKNRKSKRSKSRKSKRSKSKRSKSRNY